MRTDATRAAEGFDRRSFTVAEILRMQDAAATSRACNRGLKALPGFSVEFGSI